MNFIPLILIAGGILIGRKQKSYSIYDAALIESPLTVWTREEFAIRLKGEWDDVSNLKTLHSLPSKYDAKSGYTLFSYTSKIEGSNEMKYMESGVTGQSIDKDWIEYVEFVIITKKR